MEGDSIVRTAEPADLPDPREAIRADDGFVASFFSARVANWLLRRFVPAAVTPNQVTITSLLCALSASALFATGAWAALFVGALLTQASFVFDCLDGQLARHRNRTSRIGEWLDGITDCLQEVILLAGLTIGCLRIADDLVPLYWSYAAILVILYRTFDWLLQARVLGEAFAEVVKNPTSGRHDLHKEEVIAAARERGRKRWGWAGSFLDWLAPKGTVERRTWVFWTKRALQLRNGERYLVISICAAAGRPEAAFPILAVWGGLVYPLTTARRWQLFAAS